VFAGGLFINLIYLFGHLMLLIFYELDGGGLFKELLLTINFFLGCGRFLFCGQE